MEKATTVREARSDDPNPFTTDIIQTSPVSVPSTPTASQIRPRVARLPHRRKASKDGASLPRKIYKLPLESAEERSGPAQHSSIFAETPLQATTDPRPCTPENATPASTNVNSPAITINNGSSVALVSASNGSPLAHRRTTSAVPSILASSVQSDSSRMRFRSFKEVDARGGGRSRKPFVSQRLKGEVYKPWLEKKDPALRWARWITIGSFIIGLAVAAVSKYQLQSVSGPFEINSVWPYSLLYWLRVCAAFRKAVRLNFIRAIFFF